MKAIRFAVRRDGGPLVAAGVRGQVRLLAALRGDAGDLEVAGAVGAEGQPAPVGRPARVLAQLLGPREPASVAAPGVHHPQLVRAVARGHEGDPAAVGRDGRRPVGHAGAPRQVAAAAAVAAHPPDVALVAARRVDAVGEPAAVRRPGRRELVHGAVGQAPGLAAGRADEEVEPGGRADLGRVGDGAGPAVPRRPWRSAAARADRGPRRRSRPRGRGRPAPRSASCLRYTRSAGPVPARLTLARATNSFRGRDGRRGSGQPHQPGLSRPRRGARPRPHRRADGPADLHRVLPPAAHRRASRPTTSATSSTCCWSRSPSTG